MKILVVTQKIDRLDSNLGFFHRWVEKLSEKSEIVVIANYVGSYEFNKNVSVFSLGKENGFGRFRRFFIYQRLLLKFLSSSRGAFFHMCPEYVLGAWLLPKIFRKKSLLWYVHKSVGVRLWLAEKLVNKVFTASAESFRLKSKKMEIVGHGIDIELFKPGLPEPFSGVKMLTVGRISPVKDLKTLVFAVAELVRRAKFSADLDVVGEPALSEDENYFKEIKEISESAGSGKAIKFLGPKYYWELPDIYGSHNVFIHASKTGSLDKAVLEALACGKNVFTSSEAYDNLSSLIVKFKPGDAIDLADKIEKAFAEKHLGINEQAVNWIGKNYNLDRLINKIINFYRTNE